MPALLFLRGLPWKIILPILGVLALLWAVFDAGKDSERAVWKKREAAAIEAHRARESALQAQVDAAGLALSMSTATIERLSNEARVVTRNYYVQNPAANVQCLAADRLQHIRDADEAVENPAAAR